MSRSRSSRRASPDGPPPFLLLGQVLRPHGIRGELRISVSTAYPERIVPGTHVYVGPNPQDVSTAVLHEVAGVRKHQEYLILRFAAVPDRNAAELLRQHYVMVKLEDAVPLEDDEYYLFQVIGVSVFTVDGENLGTVSEVIETGANDVYVVHGTRGEILLPAIDECVVDLNIDARTMTVKLMDGLLDG
ncbi:MAG: 16S rRNA processing protein RimM [Chloroflexi bacterium]|nr:16S rRNA processing protein RimM [Chloroflexota bacterium]